MPPRRGLGAKYASRCGATSNGRCLKMIFFNFSVECSFSDGEAICGEMLSFRAVGGRGRDAAELGLQRRDWGVVGVNTAGVGTAILELRPPRGWGIMWSP